MYVHRPDVLSFALGVVFLVLGIVFLANPGGIEGLDAALLFGPLAVAAGVGVAGSLMMGDVHRRAAARIAARQARTAGANSTLPPPPEDPLPIVTDEDFFGSPIDPEALERAYRETFGDDDRYLGPLRPRDDVDADDDGAPGSADGQSST